MALTYQLIAKTVLASNTLNVLFSSIPQTYTDLIIRLSARDSTGAANYDIRCQLNGSGGTAYSTVQMYGNGSGAFANNYTGSSFARTGYSEASDATANIFGSDEIYIPSYTTGVYKPLSSRGTAENNSASTRTIVSAMASLWKSNSAITSVEITSGGTWVTGSSFYLYGIKNS